MRQQSGSEAPAALRLAPAEPGDVAALTAAHAAAFAEDVALYGLGPAGVGDAAWHRARIDDSVYLAIWLGRRLIGGLVIERAEAGGVFLNTFFIDPSEHGRGYGQRALRMAEQHLPEARRWALHTPHRSYRNHHLYEKCGYRKSGEVRVGDVPGLAPDFTLYVYEREVAAG